MTLTQISTAGVKDDAVTSGKIPANAVGSSELADNAVDTAAIAHEAVTLDKLPHGTSSNNGKFLRANNGDHPTFETVDTTTNLGINFFSDSATVTSSTGTNISITEATASQAGLMSTTHHNKLDGIAAGATNSPTITINTNGDNRILTGTGSTNTIQGETQLLFDSNGLLYLRAPDGGNRYFFGETGNSQSAQLSLYNSADQQKVRIAAGDGANEAATFFNGGKVGIGTSSPAVPLEIKQDLNEKLRLVSTNDNTNWKNEIGFYNATTKKAAITAGNGGDGNSVGIQLSIGTAEKARLDKDGNFQINNTSNTGTYTEDFNGSGTTTYAKGGKLNVHGGIRVTGYSSKGSHSSNGENITAGLVDFQRTSQFTRGGGLGYFTMGWKTTCRSGEVIHTETSNAYKKDGETNSCAYYLEAGASGEAGGIALDENCVYVYGSSDNGQTFRIADKDSDVVVAEMTQSSWNWNVRGGVNSNQSLATISDKTVKKGFKDVNYTNILTDFAKLQLKSFIRIDQYDYVKKKYKDQEDLREVGLVAQDVESVFPDCIAETKNLEPRSYKAVYEELGLTGDDRFTSLKNLNVNGLLYKTIAAVQELIKENTSLKNRVAALEAA